MSAIDAFFDNPFAAGFFNPKGVVADWRHAARTFVDKGFRLAPKNKFLYHVAFTFTPHAMKLMPSFAARHQVEAGVLVKNAELPKYNAAVQTYKKYNRVKNIQTNISYLPVTLNFYDDNAGVTTQLMEAYYRYYFVDGVYTQAPAAYERKLPVQPKDGSPNPKSNGGDSLYEGGLRSRFRFGLDNNSTDPFFDYVQISQLSRKEFTTYTLVNPTVSSWGHGQVDYADAGGTVENSMTLEYEAVWYTRGCIEGGADGDPKYFGAFGYDTVASPLSLLGGGDLGVGGILGGVTDLFSDCGTGGINNPLTAGIAAVNLIGNVKKLTPQSAAAGLAGVALGGLQNAANEAGSGNVGGLPGRVVP